MGVTGFFQLGLQHHGPQPRKDQTYQLTENLSWLKGKHSFKFGYEGRKFQVWNPFNARNNGSYSFSTNGKYSAGSSGTAGINFLLGLPASYSQGSGGLIIAHSYEHYFYAQDQWRVRNNLTLTYGLGYQIDTPLAETQFKRHLPCCFVPGEQSTIYPTAPIGLVYPGDKGCNAAGGATTKYTTSAARWFRLYAWWPQPVHGWARQDIHPRRLRYLLQPLGRRAVAARPPSAASWVE